MSAVAEADVMRLVLPYAVRAPSGHNAQPWSLMVRDDALLVYADRTRSLPVVDPEDRALAIGCGAAAELARLTLRHLGWAGRVQAVPDPDDPDLLARVSRGERFSPQAGDHALFEAIDERHTHRAAFADRPVADETLHAMLDAARSTLTDLRLVEPGEREELADLVAQGDRAQFADARFRAELASWVRPNSTLADDGIPGAALGMGDLASRAGPWVVRHLDTGRIQATKDRRAALTAPALVVVVTRADTPEDWVDAGQALARLLLHGAAVGVQASFLNQPIEVPALREQVRELLGVEGRPQLLLRLGHGAGAVTTPRRVTLP